MYLRTVLADILHIDYVDTNTTCLFAIAKASPSTSRHSDIPSQSGCRSSAEEARQQLREALESKNKEVDATLREAEVEFGF